MKKIFFILLAVLMFVSCSKKEDIPVVADFDAKVTGESPNAQITLANNSTGASTFKWSFDKGSADSVSTAESPAALTVDKAGEFKIKLTVSNGAEEKSIGKIVSIPGHSAILSFNNLEFGLNAGDTQYGRYFSFETGLMYRDNSINSSNGSLIHLGFGSMNQEMYYFESPTRNDLGFITIPNATQTKVINWQQNPSISVVAFDAMQDDRLLTGLTIASTNDSFDNSLPCTILFELFTSRKGVIKAKTVNNERLLADIKIQKY